MNREELNWKDKEEAGTFISNGKGLDKNYNRILNNGFLINYTLEL